MCAELKCCTRRRMCLFTIIRRPALWVIIIAVQGQDNAAAGSAIQAPAPISPPAQTSAPGQGTAPGSETKPAQATPAEEQKPIAPASDALKQISDELEQQKSELAKAKSRAEKAEADLKIASEQLNTSKSDHEKSKADLEKSKGEVQTKTTELDAAKKRAEEQTKANEEEKKAKENAQREKNEKDQQLGEANKNLNDARTKITALMIVQEDLMKQKDNLHLTYTELREKYENPELQYYITKRAEAFYKGNPGLQGAVNKTSELVLPKVQAGTLSYANLLNTTHTAIKSNLHPFVGEHSHWISGFISYGLFFIPLFLTVYCLISIRAVLKLRGMMMFCHMYFALCSLAAACMVVYLRSDPLRTLHESNAGTYVWTQLILGVVFLGYFLLQCLALFQSKALDLWISRLVQLAAVTVVGGLYYATVFTPAMLDRPPVALGQGGLIIFYGIPALVFGIMLFVEKNQADEADVKMKDEYGNKEEMEILLTTDDKKVAHGVKQVSNTFSTLLNAGTKDEEMGKDA